MTTYGGERLFCEECDVTLLEECGYTTPQAGICDDCLAKIEAQEVVTALQSIPAAEYDPDLLAARRATFLRQIAERQPVAPWTADLLGCDDVDVPTPPVSEQDDERNSRPSQY
jgi:hypothetical protein